MATSLQDLRHSLRQLLRKPIFTATAVLTLAIGMGVNAVAFSVVNGLLLKGSATSGLAGVGRIATSAMDDEDRNASIAEFERFADATRGAAELAAEGRSTVAWQHDGTTETAWVLYVTPSYFSMVNAPLIAGQLRVDRAGSNPPSAVVGERYWREKLHSPSLAGLTLRLNNTDVAVVGVMAASFTGPAGIYSPDVWLPIDDIALFSSSPVLKKRDTRWLFVMARPNDAVTTAQMQGHLDTVVAEMAREWPDTHKGNTVQYWQLGQATSERRGLGIAAGIGMGIIGLVLLLACFNVANLLLARAIERERDMGIRTALGARPSRLIRLVVTEGLVIAILSGALALMLAWWTQSLMTTFAMPIDQPQHIDMTPDGTVVLFIAALIAIAGVLPGLWPALSAARVNVLQVLGSQGANAVSARPSAMRRWLVGAQIAGSTMFLAIALLFVQSVGRAVDLDMGFARGELVLGQFEPAASGFDAAGAERYAEALLTRVRALPGVTDAALIDRAPFFIGYERLTPVWPDRGSCEAGTCPKIATLAAGPGYFRTMGIAMAAGREFDPGPNAAAVIVNQSFAKLQWPDGRGLGETIRIGATGNVFTIVGITGTHRTRGLDWERPTLYFPLGPEQYEGGLTLVARSPDPDALVRPIADAAPAIDSRTAMLGVKTMADRMGVQMWPFRTLRRIFTICGLLALILATVGLAGAVIHAVSRRQREFGVRVSIGATPRDLIGDVLRSSMRLLLPGLAVGILLAAAIARLVQVIFLGVNVLNPLTYAAVALIECAIVLVACVGPAIRASRVDPLIALRSE